MKLFFNVCWVPLSRKGQSTKTREIPAWWIGDETVLEIWSIFSSWILYSKNRWRRWLVPLKCVRHPGKGRAGKGSDEVKDSSGITAFSVSAPVTACSVERRVLWLCLCHGRGAQQDSWVLQPWDLEILPHLSQQKGESYLPLPGSSLTQSWVSRCCYFSEAPDEVWLCCSIPRLPPMIEPKHAMLHLCVQRADPPFCKHCRNVSRDLCQSGYGLHYSPFLGLARQVYPDWKPSFVLQPLLCSASSLPHWSDPWTMLHFHIEILGWFR